jgi:Tfp pilus assembly protein PilW
LSDTSSRQADCAGLTLIELLVAICLASMILMGAWPWCWTMVRECHEKTQREQVASSLAFAGRLFTSEVRRASGLGDEEGRGCGASSLALKVADVATGRTELVAYRYDPARAVLWRKAPGSYVAEGLSSCRLSYSRADGSEVLLSPDGTVAAGDLDSVRAITLDVAVELDNEVCERSWTVALRTSGR